MSTIVPIQGDPPTNPLGAAKAIGLALVEGEGGRIGTPPLPSLPTATVWPGNGVMATRPNLGGDYQMHDEPLPRELISFQNS